MGDGSTSSSVQQSYDFITPPIVAVCGTLCVQPGVTSNTPICPGQTAIFTITGTPGDIISYKINGGTTQTIVISPSGSVTVSISSPTIDQTINLIYVLGGTGSCSNNLSLTQTISVGGSSTIPTFSPVSSICQGNTLAPLPTTSLNGISGTWTPVLNNMSTTTYTFTPSVSSCGGTATMTIVVTPPGTTPTFTQIATICEGDTLTPLPTTSLEGIDGVWTPALNTSLTMTYTFSPTVGICLNTTQMTITVLPKTTTAFTQLPSICSGAVLNPLPTISNNGVSGTWSPALNNTQTTTYNFTPDSGVCATSTSMTIIVNPLLTPVFTAIAPICEGAALAPLPTVSNNTISGSWTPVINNLATTTYTFNPASGACSTTTQITIVVNLKQTPTFLPFETICYGDANYTLPLVSNNGIHGTWSPIINNTQTSNYTFTPNSGECANIVTLPLSVYNDFNFDYLGYCKENNFYLEVVPLNQSIDLNTAAVIWQQNNSSVGTSPILNVTAYLNALPNAPVVLPIVFTVKVTNSNGCDKMQSITIDDVFCGIQKGISVNNDNLNDFFDLRLLDVKKLTIFNRYGMIVYNKSDYYNEWKGQTNSGDELPDGVYYYVIDFKNSDSPSKTGWIYVNRETK